MMKRSLLIVLLGSLFLADMRADEELDVKQLLARVDLVLFVLKRNTLCMERYRLDELDSEINQISREMSEKHCVFKIKMRGANSRANCVAWDNGELARLKIITSARSGKKNDRAYYLPIDRVIPEEFQTEELALVCFDCAVEHSNLLKTKRGRPRKLWRSRITVAIPAVEGQLSMDLIVDGKVDAACGFFIQNDIFEGGIPLTGKMDMWEAINKGVLVTNGESVQVDYDNSESISEVEQEVVVQEVDVKTEVESDVLLASDVQKEPLNQEKEKENLSLCDRINSFIVATKNCMVSSWHKIWG